MNDIDKILSKFQYGFSHQFTDPKGGLSQEETSAQIYSLLMDVIETNQKGQFEDEAGNVFWYLDDLVKAINQLFNKENQ